MNGKQTGWWTITEDKLADLAEGDRPAVGTCGPRDCTLTADQIKAHPATLYFQMFDDDGEHYYSGLCILPQGLTDEAFRPLDDYGTPTPVAPQSSIETPPAAWKPFDQQPN